METDKNTIHLSRLCRACKAECSDMSSLFVLDNDVGSRLDDMLMSCTNLKISENDGFPNSICKGCIDELKVAYHFKQRCKPMFTCIECSQSFNTLRGLMNHKSIHLNNETKTGMEETVISNEEYVVQNAVELEELLNDGGVEDSSSGSVSKESDETNDIKGSLALVEYLSPNPTE